jgi:1-deoxy-D-xylulose-5-phosphate synthase
LTEFSRRFPDRFFDVGICEQHAVTFAAGLAAQGYKPVVAIYSTFMQRSYDQIVHDVCLQNLPVSFFLDRGGLVGEDGPTHHGVFDIAYLRHIPNMVVMVPKDELELKAMTELALNHPGPSAVRYPRGVGIGIEPNEPPAIVEMGKGEYLLDGRDLLIIALGSRVHPCLDAALSLREEGISAAVFNARFVKPLPEDQLLELARRFSKILIAEEGVLAGGFGSAVLEFLSDRGALFGQTVKRLGIPDQFVEHGPQRALRGRIGIDGEGIKQAVRELAGS